MYATIILAKVYTADGVCYETVASESWKAFADAVCSANRLQPGDEINPGINVSDFESVLCVVTDLDRKSEEVEILYQREL